MLFRSYQSFLLCAGLDTLLYEFRSGEQLLAVAVTDPLEQGLSAVYTFYDPDQAARSLGRYSILWQIHEARRLGLPWLYLGYWIKECRKMSYKDEYRPLETFRHGHWSRSSEGRSRPPASCDISTSLYVKN